MSFEQMMGGPPAEKLSPEELERILGKLPPLSRKILELRCGDRQSYEEIAEELELPVGSVKKYMRGALTMARLIALGVEDQ